MNGAEQLIAPDAEFGAFGAFQLQIMRVISESDWKIWRKISEIALEKFCQKTLKGIAKLAAGSDSAHGRYLELFEYLAKADKNIEGAFNDLRRSTALDQLTYAVREGLVSRKELKEFSKETQEIVKLWLHEH